MDERFLFLAILLPIIGGILTPVIGKRSQKALYGWVFAVSIATSLLTWALILTCKTDSYTIVGLTDVLTLTLRFDGLGRFFAGIVATLWPLTVLYASYPVSWIISFIALFSVYLYVRHKTFPKKGSAAPLQKAAE